MKHSGKALVLAAALTCTGCSVTGASADGAPLVRDELPPIGLSPRQTMALADGSVSISEYQESFARYEACMSDAGHPLANITRGEELIEYSVPDEAVQSGNDDRCYQREFAGVDEAWQIANEDDSFTTRLLQACLIGHGITPFESAVDVAEQAAAAGLTPDACQSYAGSL
jgi:hypothetical protein